MKYYGTIMDRFFVPKEVLESYGVLRSSRQYRVVCKAKSLAEANRIVQKVLECNYKIFYPLYTAVTGNPNEIINCDLYQVIISLNDGGIREYTSLQDVYNKIQEFKKNN
jgi:hypothetical protein